MRSTVVIMVGLLIGMLFSCENEKNTDMDSDIDTVTVDSVSTVTDIEKKTYYDSEIFSTNDLKIYGKWRLYIISGGYTGRGYKKNFDYLEIKEYGKYGFIRNDTILEYGKIVLATQTPKETRLRITFQEDVNSTSFLGDKEKSIYFKGNDTLTLLSPCCDRYSYSFERVK